EGEGGSLVGSQTTLRGRMGHGVSRETSGCRLQVFATAFPPEISGQDTQRCRCHPIDPAGLPHGPRLMRAKLGARFIGEPRYLAVVNAGQDQALVAAEGVDVGSLALEIDVVLGVGLKVD